MKLFFYILREYLKYVLGTITLTIFLFILFDFIHKTTQYFAAYEPATIDIIRFYLYQMPSQLVQALPIAALLASVVCMILLSRSNEVTAMRAAGMGPVTIAMPLIVGGLGLSVFSMLINELVVPVSAKKMHYVKQVLIEKESDDEIADGARWLRDGQTFINFGDYDPINQVLTKVKLIEAKANFRLTQSVEAESAHYIPAEKIWTLKGIKVLYFRGNGTVDRIEYRQEQRIKLPIEPKKLKKERRKPNELSVPELSELIAKGELSGVDTLPYKVDYHAKFAYPFAAFVVSLIGLKFGYRSERATETAKGVLLAFAIGISYWFILSSGRALGRRGDISPFVAAWLANAVVLGITFLDVWRARRS